MYKYCPCFPQLVVGLLFLTAIAGLAVTLGEDFGSSKGEPVSPEKNPGVFYANPVLYAVTWVNIACFLQRPICPGSQQTDE